MSATGEIVQLLEKQPMTNHRLASAFLVCGTLLAGDGGGGGRAAEAAEPARATALGSKVANSNSLRDLRGNRRSLQGFAGKKATVVAFLGADCPVSNLYVPRLIELEGLYRSKQVQFLAVYPNEHEDLEHLAMHASDRDL